MSEQEFGPALQRALELPAGERPAPQVRAAVLRAIRAVDPAERGGRPVGAVLAPYRTEADKLRRILAGFADRRQWDLPLEAADGWTVLEILAHLAAVDAVLLSGLAPGIPPAHRGLDPGDLMERTEALQRLQRRRPPAETLRLWWSQVEEIGDQIMGAGPALLERPVAFVGGPQPVRDLLVDRAFETWIHADDIRGGIGNDPVRPQADHLDAMVELGVRALRQVVSVTEAVDPAVATSSGHVSLVLTGGGTWDVPVGPAGAQATVTVDVVAFCRLLARRHTVDDVPATVTGDRRLARRVLTAAAAIGRP